MADLSPSRIRALDPATLRTDDVILIVREPYTPLKITVGALLTAIGGNVPTGLATRLTAIESAVVSIEDRIEDIEASI